MADSMANPAAGGVSQEEETTTAATPDLLKNTPLNIARLEDVIEHSKGRHKYLAHTRSPSDGGDVRWYFCKVPLAADELAASIPRTEIVGKGDYFRFGMRDSLAIEVSFLQREEELLSIWWREYAECSEGPRGRPSTSKLDSQKHAYSSGGAGASELYDIDEERVGVPVKGGLYEVDLVKRHCFPVYWNGENRRVLRGHWFARKGGLDWLPLREDVAEQLEVAYRSQVWHRRTFQPSGLFAARVDLQGSTPGLHALFTGEDDTWEAWLSVDASGFSSFVSLSRGGIKLRRGYSASNSTKPTQDELRQRKEEEMDDYCSQVPVRHLVFMVHGIGQRLEKSNLVDDVGNFRHITASLAERHLTSHQLDSQRVLFIPCQWRKGLKLSGETAVEKITLDGVRGLRTTLSATVHDVLYYMSPIYCQDIIDSIMTNKPQASLESEIYSLFLEGGHIDFNPVSNQLNWLYLKFLKRNPGYDGKVSIYGHSLGSVLSYDILCHQENMSAPFPMDLYKECARNEESSQEMNNHSSNCNSLINKESKSSSMVVNETKEKADHADEQVASAQSTQDNGLAKYGTTILMPASDLDNMSLTPVDSTHRSGGDSACELVDNSNNIPLGRMKHLADAAPMENSDLKNIIADDRKDEINKEDEIELLRDKINILKAKLAVLESCGGPGQENREALPCIPSQPNQPIPPKVAPFLDDAPRSYTPYIKYTKLEFKVDTFFAVGSPLGVFLALRNIRIGIGKGQDYWAEENINEEMPACHQMFNIFHPYDPVAYRIEPLVCKDYITKRPVIIPYHKGGKRLHIGFQEFTEDIAVRSQAIVDHLNFVKVKVLTVCQSRTSDRLEDGAEDVQEKEESTYGPLMMERVTGSKDGRIDHMLQDKTFEHPYLQAIGSHTNYWRDSDTALFILKHLYRDIPEEANAPASTVGNSKGAGRSRERETAEEELPLTFSDQLRVRTFSRTAKNFMKS